MLKHQNVFSASVPVSALTVVPRSVTVAASPGMTSLRPFSSLPNPDNSPDETDSSLIDYQQARHTTAWVTLVRTCVVIVHLL